MVIYCAIMCAMHHIAYTSNRLVFSFYTVRALSLSFFRQNTIMNLESSCVPKLAFDYLGEAEKSYLETGCFNEKDLEVLHSFFGEHLVLATELLEKCKIIKYRLPDDVRTVFKIVTKHEQCTIFDNINFCHCNIFRIQVLETRNAITCKHILAVKLGKITGQIVEETVTGSQLVDFLNEQLNFIQDRGDS